MGAVHGHTGTRRIDTQRGRLYCRGGARERAVRCDGLGGGESELGDQGGGGDGAGRV